MRNFFTVLDYEKNMVKLAESSGSRYVVDVVELSMVVVISISLGTVIGIFLIILSVSCYINRSKSDTSKTN